MRVLIDLSGLQNLMQEQKWADWLTQMAKQIEVLATNNIAPEFLLLVHPNDDLNLAKQTINLLAPQATTHYLALEPFPPFLRGQVLAHFLQDRNIACLLTPFEGCFALLESIRAAQKYHHTLLVIDDAKQLQAIAAKEGEALTKEVGTTSESKPYLAIVSPYPPQKTGIADYLAQLLPDLANHYIPVLVIDDDLSIEQFSQFDGLVLHAQEFLKRPDLHERVLYQIGNSPAHLYALDLLKRIPGCVVLHDFYLGNALAYGQFSNGQDHLFTQALIDSHGQQALLSLKNDGLDHCIKHYPCSFPLFGNAQAIGVHTHYTHELAHQWYGPIPDNLITKLPFPKPLQAPQRPDQRQLTLSNLGFPDNAFIVASFGFGTPSKMHEQVIIAWLESDLANADHTFLVLVGEYSSPNYLEELKKLIPPNYKDRIRFTGFVDLQKYNAYLAITDLAVQLRDQSRGESSAAIMDCLACQIPVIANYLGTVIEFPEKVIWKLANQSICEELLISFNTLFFNSSIRTALGLAGYHFIRDEHQPAITAKAYYNWIERTITQSSKAHENQLIAQLHMESLSQEEQIQISKALIVNRPALGKRQFLLDISDTAKHDKRTGIQRVVRSLGSQWLRCPPTDRHTCLIYADDEGGYRYAYDYIFREFQISYACPENSAIHTLTGDLYLGLDLNLITVVDNIETIKEWRAHGVEIAHIVYDLLPIQYPQWFLPFVEYLFRRWLDVVSVHSDKLLADSHTIAKDLKEYLDEASKAISGQASSPVQIGWFHHGCDLAASLPTQGLDSEAKKMLLHLKANPTFLMVSTIEPRKGYTQTLDAFELLWQEGIKVNLVIVGKVGWYVEELIERLQSHEQLGNHLFWVSDISDEYLDCLYENSQAVICASFAEGFGLPIIEAAHHQTPVIARDIAVFREVGGQGVDYFSADTPNQLAQFIQQWLQLKPNQKAQVRTITIQNWSQSALQAQHFLFNAKSLY